MGNKSMKAQKKAVFHEEEIHRVLGTKFTPPFPEDTEYIILGPGCFWGGEKHFWRLPGVYTTASGFCKDKASRNSRAFVEAVLVVFDEKLISAVDLIRMFLQCHDPTQKGGQGNDIGQAYRSCLFFNTDDQRRIAEAAISSYSSTIKKEVVTEVMEGLLDDFAYADDSHQQYLASAGANMYSSARPIGIQVDKSNNWLPDDLKSKYVSKLDENFWKQHSPEFQSVLHVPNERIKYSVAK